MGREPSIQHSYKQNCILSVGLVASFNKLLLYSEGVRVFHGRCLLVEGMASLWETEVLSKFGVLFTIVLLVYKPQSYQDLFLK